MSKQVEWLTVEDAAKLCGVSETRIRKICINGWRNGTFRIKRKGKRLILINPADVLKFKNSERDVGNPNIVDHASAGGKKGAAARWSK